MNTVRSGHRFQFHLLIMWTQPSELAGIFFQVTPTRHPVTEPVSSDTPWSSFRVQQYWQLEVQPNDVVLIQYAGTTHPALVQRTFVSDGTTSAAGRLCPFCRRSQTADGVVV